MIIELRYIPREGAARDPQSRYDCGFGFARFEVDADTADEQAEELALRYYRRHPPADLEAWTFEFPA